MAAHGEILLRSPADVPTAGDVLGGVAHAHIGVRLAGIQGGVGHRVVAPHRHPAHALHPGADEHLTGSDGNLASGEVDGLHGRAAEAIDRRARHRDRQIRQQHQNARQIIALLAFREGAAENDVLDVGRGNAGAFDQSTHHRSRQIVRADTGKSAFAGECERRAGVAGDNGGCHAMAPRRIGESGQAAGFTYCRRPGLHRPAAGSRRCSGWGL